MQPLDMQTPDLTQANIAKIAQLFPHVVTEAEDEDGKLVKKVDFDLLKQELSKDVVEDTTERYRLDRPGKKRSILKANTPITKTLRPVQEDSVNWDTTENLYLEGDNFEVLKILQESYLGKIKMIYIDPPYNTGKDFVYKDDFKVSKADYEGEIGAVDEEGGKLFKNTDANGRYHSDWLSMMFSRLTIARDLLKDDGVIFMSIDDNEVHNLRKIADEVFGEENFIGQLPRKLRNGGKNDSQFFRKNIDYILGYAKNIETCKMISLDLNTENYNNFDEYKKERGGYQTASLDANLSYSKSNDYPFEFNGETYYPGGKEKYESRMKHGAQKSDYTWRWSKPLMEFALQKGFIIKSGNKIRSKVYENVTIEKDGNDYKLSEITRTINPALTHFVDNTKYSSQAGSSELKDLDIPFSAPKPTSLLIELIGLFCNRDDIILDFFSGSGTVAHAVMEINANDRGKRKHIQIQIPEDIMDGGNGVYKYITEIGKERIRRAGKKILEDNKDKEGFSNLDVGFRVYKTDSSNMKDVFYHPSTIKQSDLGLYVSNVKDDRTPQDLLTQVMLDLGLTLDLPLEEKKIKGNTVFFVAGNSLVACFDEKIDFSIIDEIGAIQPLKVVFRDSSFRTDADRINVETRMKRLSPDTRVSVL